MVMLPELLDRLARLAHQNNGAIGITKVENNVYYVSMGGGRGVFVDVVGRDLIPRTQLVIEETLH